MQIPILVEPVPGRGFRASDGGPFALTAEGPTPEEAVAKLREQIGRRMTAGARVQTLDLPGHEHPWAKGAGMFKDDPLFDEWQQAIAEYRRQADAEPELP